MQLYETEIKALNPKTGQLATYGGPNVPGISHSDAEDYCQRNGLGYCKVLGVLIAEIPCTENWEPDWDNMVDYENNLN